MRKFKKTAFPLASAVLISILSAAEIYNMRPFGTGAYLALLMSTAPIYVTAPVYLLAQAMFVTTTAELWGYVASTLAGVTAKLIFMRLKKPLPPYVAAVAGALGACGFIYAGFTGVLTPLNIILSSLFSLLFMLVGQLFLKPLAEPLGYAGATEPELLAGCVILAAAFIALARPIVGEFNVGYLSAATLTLAATSFFGIGAGMACALSMGLGMSLAVFEPYPIAVLTFAAALCAVFKDGHKLLCAAGYFLGFVMSLFLFTSQGLTDVVSAFVGCVVFAVIPKKALSFSAIFAGKEAKKAALIASYNRFRHKAGGELMTAADIFSQMIGVMSDVAPDEKRAGMYADKILCDACGSCSHRDGCKARSFDVMERLMESSLKYGSASVSGMPEQVLDHCKSIGLLVGKVNLYAEKNRGDKAKDAAYESASRLLKAQLGGAEGIMRRLASRLAGEAVFDTAGEEKIVEELTYGGCRCIGATSLKDGDTREVSVIVREKDFDKDKTTGILKRLYKRTFFFVSFDPHYSPSGYTGARFKSGSPLDLVFGVSQIGKDGSGYIGDKYSFTRIGASGFMMAISDGMGTGKKASEVGESAVSLVENYYRAGFDTRFVLSSVNRFLSLGREESFSAMDILVLNLDTLNCDLIKIGSPSTRIRREGKVASLGGGSLPLGALEEISPYLESVRVKEGDMIVMLSDGVEDAFPEGALEALLERETTINPQILSRKVLDEALRAYGGVQRDDMTVLCGRVYMRV